MVIPQALRVNRLAIGRRYCTLGRLSSEVGWKYADVVSKLEEKRKAKSAVYYQKKKALLKLRAKAVANTAAALADTNKQLAALGY